MSIEALWAGIAMEAIWATVIEAWRTSSGGQLGHKSSCYQRGYKAVDAFKASRTGEPSYRSGPEGQLNDLKAK